MEKCLRCNSKEAMFACMECEVFRILCERCDNYLHGLPGKKGHNRIAMTVKGEESLKSKSFHKTNRINPSNNNNNNTSNINDNPEEMANPNNNPNNLSSDFTTYDNNNLNNNNNNNNNVNKTTSNPQTNTPFQYSSIYARDYLTDLKSTYSKDKIELQCQGTSLKNSLDKIRLTLIEQINAITSQIDSYEMKQQNITQSLENKFNAKLYNIVSEKEEIIISWTDKVKVLEDRTSKLSTQWSQQTDEHHWKIVEYDRKVKELEDIIITKDEALYWIRQQLESTIDNSKADFDAEINRVSRNYENKIRQILNDGDKEREELTKLINDREMDIRNIIENNKGHNDDLICAVKRWKADNDIISNEWIKCREEKDQFERNCKMLNIGENEWIKSTREKEDYIIQLEEKNKMWFEENRTMMSKIEKLEGIVYGKVKK